MFCGCTTTRRLPGRIKARSEWSTRITAKSLSLARLQPRSAIIGSERAAKVPRYWDPGLKDASDRTWEIATCSIHSCREWKVERKLISGLISRREHSSEVTTATDFTGDETTPESSTSHKPHVSNLYAVSISPTHTQFDIPCRPELASSVRYESKAHALSGRQRLTE